jgi:hypothetical protein
MSTRSFRKAALVSGILFIALLALASSQVGAETPTIISTTFTSEDVSGTFDEELQSIIGHDNGWVVQMTNPRVERSPYYDPSLCKYDPSGADCGWFLIVDSFTFKFTGPDAELLNDRVGQYLIQGWAGGGWTDLDLMRIDDRMGSCTFDFYVGSDEGQNHIYFDTRGYGYASCQKDADGTPILDDIIVNPVSTWFFDFRPGYAGYLGGYTGSMSMYFLMGLPKTTVNMSINEAAIGLKDGKMGIKGYLDVSSQDLVPNPQARIIFELQTGGTADQPEFEVVGEDQFQFTTDVNKLLFKR